MWETKVYNGEKVKRFSEVFKVGLFPTTYLTNKELKHSAAFR